MATTWPAPWDRCWTFVPATPRMVWTYMELGRDLCGEGDPDRGTLFRSLLAHLQWPKGTTAFWPACCPQAGGNVVDADIFWQGCAVLGIRHVACFGSQALGLICPQADPSLLNCSRGAVTVHILPAPGELLKLLPHDRHLIIDRLRSLRLEQS